MPILRLNAAPGGVAVNGSPACARSAICGAALGAGPVIILIHGCKYDPDITSRSPHTSIFGHPAHPSRARTVPWLRHLGFGTGNAGEGLAIAFAWPARANLWRAERAARNAGRHLAEVVALIRQRAPHRPVHVISHSMGSEVIFEALGYLPKGAIARIVALSGASYASRAMAAMQTPAGRGAELFNITSRENDVFDFMFERLITPPACRDWALGGGIDLPNAVNIQLDCARTLAALTGFGGHIAPPRRRMCHWSSYTRPGVLRFYAHALRDPDAVPLAALQQVLPTMVAPRWSRMFARPHLSFVLPTRHKPAS